MKVKWQHMWSNIGGCKGKLSGCVCPPPRTIMFIVGSKEALGTLAPISVQSLLFSCSFQKNLLKWWVFTPKSGVDPLGKIMDPLLTVVISCRFFRKSRGSTPPQENPRSALVKSLKEGLCIKLWVYKRFENDITAILMFVDELCICTSVKRFISDSKSCLSGLNWPRSEKTVTFWHFFGWWRGH